MDLRVKKTYKALIEALAELMEERPFEEITVAALCDRAMIRRTTFYKHFADKYEFLSFAFQNLWDEFKERAGGALEGQGIRAYGMEFMREFREFLSEHEKLADNTVLDGRYDTVMTTMRETLAYNIAEGLREEHKQGARLLADPETEAAFMAGGIMETLRHWWVSERPDGVVDGAVNIFEALLEKSGIDPLAQPIAELEPREAPVRTALLASAN